MPKVQKEIAKCKHPNSRKTIALAKQINKEAKRKKAKLGQFVKQNLSAEKLAWFKDNLNPDVRVYTPELTKRLIDKYLSRFDEELEQITIKHSVGARKNRQHASREDTINYTKKREYEEFSTCGIEIPDLLNAKNLEVLRNWNGELRYLSHIKVSRMNKKFLEKKSGTAKIQHIDQQNSKSATEDLGEETTKNLEKNEAELTEEDTEMTTNAEQLNNVKTDGENPKMQLVEKDSMEVD